jgi:hypothetical protein
MSWSDENVVDPPEADELETVKVPLNSWRTAAGEIIKIKDMSDSHLVNTIRFIKKSAIKNMRQELSAAYCVSMVLTGEHAQDACDQSIEEMEDILSESGEYSIEDILERSARFKRMIKEADKRRLNYA